MVNFEKFTVPTVNFLFIHTIFKQVLDKEGLIKYNYLIKGIYYEKY